MRRPVRLLAALLLAVAFLPGCRNEGPVIGGKQRPKVYSAIVSLSPSSTELIGVSQSLPKLVGRTGSDDWPPSVGRVPIVAQVKPDYELIAKIKPDLIVLDSDLYSPSDMERIKGLKADVIDINPKTLEEYKLMMFQLGTALGQESYISGYWDRIYRNLVSAKSVLGGKELSVALLIPATQGEHMIAGTGTFQASEIASVGAKPVGPNSAKFETLNPEMLIKEDPDYIMTAGDPTPIFKDPRFAHLKAVTKQHIFGLVDSIALRAGARVDVFIQRLTEQLSHGK